MSNIITAIDIGSSNIKTVICIVDEKGKAKVVGEASHESYGIKKGEITGIDEAINAIAASLTSAEKMAGITVSSAYVSINGKNILSNNNKGVVAISDSEILEEDVYRALEQARTIAIPQSREIIHLIPREYVVDQQAGIKNPVGMTGSRLEVDAHIISAPVTSIHNIERCIQSIGLRIDDIVACGWAASQAVLTPTEKELGVLLLDIGGGTTTITSFEEDAITYCTSIPFGGANVTRDLAAGLRMSLEDAERVKVNIDEIMRQSSKKKSRLSEDKEMDEKDDDEPKGKKEVKEEEETGDVLNVENLGIENIKTISKKFFSEIVEERMREIFEYVKDNVEQAGYEYKLPAGIVITGGTSQLPGLTKLASEIFNVPTRVASPRGLEGLLEGISAPQYAAVQGMILHGLDDNNYASNPGRYPSQVLKGGNGIMQKVIDFAKGLLP